MMNETINIDTFLIIIYTALIEIFIFVGISEEYFKSLALAYD